MKHKEVISILGAGLVGSLLGLQLAQLGYQVRVFEKRNDPRSNKHYAGRSINLALSKRGLKALGKVGLEEKIKEFVIPMHGRIVHLLDGSVNFQPYGKEGQYINSVSRSGLNLILIEEAEKAGVLFHFGHRCDEVMLDEKTLVFSTSDQSNLRTNYDILLGADGAFSILRNTMQRLDRFSYSQDFIQCGYKELSIPPNAAGDFAMDPNGLHIWPRGRYMLIALPNPDKSFTLTLFLPFQGSPSFESVQSQEQAKNFFQSQFSDALSHMPQGVEEYFSNPTSSLVTIKCHPWVYGSHTALIGDAAHAIVPFYGQGMNAGFEDCHVLADLLAAHQFNWEETFKAFEHLRKDDADAIADLALNNFIEMRDLVADTSFLTRKKIEAKLNELYPDQWLPLYSMVTFSDFRYSQAKSIGLIQDQVLKKIMERPDIESTWADLDFSDIIQEFEKLKSKAENFILKERV
jgi:kynurenine 3-monooxygenase